MKLLIVVDMQKDFIDGALGSPEAQAIVPNVKKMIEEYQAAGEDVIFTLYGDPGRKESAGSPLYQGYRWLGAGFRLKGISGEAV